MNQVSLSFQTPTNMLKNIGFISYANIKNKIKNNKHNSQNFMKHIKNN